MCGISIILSPNRKERNSFIEISLNLMEHRGPDAVGKWSDNNIVTLGHNRLSILDLSSSGNQPISSNCGRFTMVYNGEIYNHLELRQKYLPHIDFISHSDSETIVNLYSQLGENMFEHMVGMWAIGIWDNQLRKLIVSRDRFGQKPLYYTKNNDSWGFASEIMPLLCFQKSAVPNSEMLADYLANGNYHHLNEKTFLNGILQLRPATYAVLSIDSNELIETKYWKLPILSESFGRKCDKPFLNKLKNAIEQAVLSQTISDVPIGMTLSGGIDSSIIAGILFKYYKSDLTVFTAQTPGNKYDESKYVKELCLQAGTNVNLISENLDDTISKEEHDQTLLFQEEPFGDPSIIAHRRLIRAANENGIKVILGGQGADELFWGYDFHINLLLSHCLRRFKFIPIIKWVKNGYLTPKSTIKILLAALLPGLEHFSRKLTRQSRINKLPPIYRTTVISAADLSNVNKAWSYSIYHIHLPHLVHYDDRNCMSYSVEGRMPFLDHRIIEILGELKPSEFVANGFRKGVLREACKEYLPKAIYSRNDKIGFFTPIKEILLSWPKNTFSSSTSTSQAYDKFSKNPNMQNALKLYRLYSVERWKSCFNKCIDK